jgi:hypothetical protein
MDRHFSYWGFVLTQKSPSPAARRLSRWVAAAVVAAMVLVAGPAVLASAQTRIGLNGARPSEWPIVDSLLAGAGFTQEAWLPFALHVGENWLPGTTPVAVDYPAQLGILSGPFALTVDQSTEIGRQNLHATILEQLEKDGEPVVVAGLSEGTLVIDRELEYLRTAPDAPPAGDITFYVFGDMRRGLGEMYLRGVTIPFVGQTFDPVPESQYDTVVVNEQWDGWANPPDRPWNLLAVANAVIGAFITLDEFNDHTHSSLAGMSDAVLVSQTTNSLGGTTSTYMIPRQQLPITRVLRQLNVPDQFVDEIDKLLMPLIATGYSSMTPAFGPRIEQGRLVWTPPAPAPQPDSTETAAVTPAKDSAGESRTADADRRTEKRRVESPEAQTDLTAPATTAGSVEADYAELDQAPEEVFESATKRPRRGGHVADVRTPREAGTDTASDRRARPDRIRASAGTDRTDEASAPSDTGDSRADREATRAGAAAGDSKRPGSHEGS